MLTHPFQILSTCHGSDEATLSTASTASVPSSPSSPAPVPALDHDPVPVKPITFVNSPAIVSWQDGKQAIRDLTCDIYRRHAVASDSAFIKLRACMSLKDAKPSKTSVFPFIHPECIQSLIVDNEIYNQTKLREPAREKLLAAAGGGHIKIYCLRFCLNKPAALVVPDTAENLVPENQTSGTLFHSLQMLAMETEFVFVSACP